MARTWAWGTLTVVMLAAAAAILGWQFSPWPKAIYYRTLMDMGGRQLADAMDKHVPAGIVSQLDRRYDLGWRDALYDVFYPSELEAKDRTLPTIVWIHGGGFISGDKKQINNYASIIAAKGYTVVSINYSLAPGYRYPTPMRQANYALGDALRAWKQLHIDPNRIVLAGDSAGAQIAGQLANLITNPDYARKLGDKPVIGRDRLIGVMLFCGILDPTLLSLEGKFGDFLKVAGWSYFGRQDFLDDPRMKDFSVVGNVTAGFPPLFVSAGNGDPLLPHSLALADAAEKQGVRVDKLFFPKDHAPPLPHEYQFNLDNDAGQLALQRALAFLASLGKP